MTVEDTERNWKLPSGNGAMNWNYRSRLYALTQNVKDDGPP